jgi:regulator of RNase E activity RraB
MGILNFFGGFRKADLDESVLVQLRTAGSDMAKPHKIEFFLYFDSMGAAEQAASRVRDDGFHVQVSQEAQGDDWLCLATKRLVPELSALQKIRSDFESLAASLDGQYDGWGTEVEK